MSRMPLPATLDAAPQASRPLLEGVKAKYGMIPNFDWLVSASPAALEGYLGLANAMDKAALDSKTREQIALAVANVNGCNYCNAAHTAVAKMLKFDPAEIEAARQGQASDAKAAAIVAFARKIALTRAAIGDEDLATVRAAGVSDAELVETVVHVALNVLTNYVNIVFDTPIDFPKTTAATRVD